MKTMGIANIIKFIVILRFANSEGLLQIRNNNRNENGNDG